MLARAALSRGVTALRLSKNVTFYMNESVSPSSGCESQPAGEQKPVMLMLPWLGSRPQALTKYCEIYFRTGFDVLVVESEVQEFLWPRWGLDHGKRLLELLQTERFVSRPLLVHAFSIGGYTFAQLLVHVSEDTQKYQALTQRIKGQVYDSLVVGSLERMAIGLGKTMFPRWESLVKQASLLYFGMFKRQTVDYFNKSIDVFHNNPLTAPALFFFCENDPLSDAQAVEELIDVWRKHGMDITAKKWEDSTHAGHLKRHQQEYLTTIDTFFHSLGIAPLKAKMSAARQQTAMPAQTIFVGSLPATATNERLEEIFSEIGPVKQCFVVREKGAEKCRGFGYVTYSMEEDAQRAMKEIKDYDGKKISLSVAKKKIRDNKKSGPKDPPKEEPAAEKATAPKENEQKAKSFRKSSLKARLIIRNLSFKCSEDDLKEVCAKFGTVLEAKIPLKPDGKMRGFAFVMFKNLSEAARALNALNLKEIKGRQVAVDWAVAKNQYVATQQASSAGNKSTVEATAKQSDAESDTEEEDEEKTQSAPQKKKNLSFDTEEEGLEEVLLQYGELNYIKVVIHPDTAHSKGCAFAQFKTKEAADRCMAAAQDEAENGGIRVDGRKLLIVAAVTREDAVKLKTNKVKVETGTRNLYLAREGLIRAGTKAAEGVPEADMAKRERFEEIKRTKLRDINIYVSRTRLCVHNLPKAVDNKKLKTLCLQAVKGTKGVRVTECRVMYDRKPEKGQVMGQSLGYGFVQFVEHEHALSALRYLNNNPNIFGSHKRPIVEFSLEDSKKLKIKQMRQEKNKEFIKNQSSKGRAKPQSQTAQSGKGPHQSSSSEQPGKEKARPQHQKQDARYAGFQTKPEVEHVDLENGKKRRRVLPLPSHRGPKIRMRDKGKQQAPPPKRAKPGFNKKDRRRQQMEKPTQPRNQVKAAKRFRRSDGDRFDSLVEQYKKKLMGNSDKNTNMKRNKWFDS
ncbi:RNA-binding protein 28 [Collichthys lucidus]|uniref:RNA-binding protein 28 n=1 Tax=Collichthys lucidus TaxID=240159 RepID=A0A4U5UIP0_COLLU|nr:RNA-binding protein 28 [Collichthys lucidus]